MDLDTWVPLTDVIALNCTIYKVTLVLKKSACTFFIQKEFNKMVLNNTYILGFSGYQTLEHVNETT